MKAPDILSPEPIKADYGVFVESLRQSFARYYLLHNRQVDIGKIDSKLTELSQMASQIDRTLSVLNQGGRYEYLSGDGVLTLRSSPAEHRVEIPTGTAFLSTIKNEEIIDKFPELLGDIRDFDESKIDTFIDYIWKGYYRMIMDRIASFLLDTQRDGYKTLILS